MDPKVKGIAFRTIDRCFLELQGAAAHARARELMRAEVRDAFAYRTLLAASWYPIAWYKETFRAFRQATGAGPELARSIGRLAARRDMAGVHKQILAKLISPQALLGMAQRVFNTYYDVGNLTISESRSGYVRVSCENCAGWNENMWSELVGSCGSLLEIAGGRHIRLRVVSGGGDGDDAAVLEAHWA